MAKRAELSGHRFGRLAALRLTGAHDSHSSAIWECQCDCGKTCEVPARSLLAGDTRSCGCLHNDLFASQREKAWAATHQDGTSPALLRKMKPRKGNTSGVRGVSWHKGEKKWQARITFRGQTISLGYFEKLGDAAQARKNAEEKYFGKYLKRNE